MLQQPNIMGQNNAGAFTEGVNMFIFSPSSHGTTILRPQVFNFNEQMADEFMSTRASDNLNTSFKNPNSELKNAILPSQTGIQLDTYNFDQFWSFILVADGNAMPLTGSTYAAPKNRTVLTGYFLDEPFAPHTLGWVEPVPNLAAKILFTQESRVTMQTLQASMGARTHIKVSANNDLIPQAMSVMSSEDLMVCDTGTIAKNVSFDDGGDQRFVSNNDAVVGQFTKAHANPRDRYSPRHQLIGLSQSIHSGMVEVGAEVDKYATYGQPGMGQHIPSKFMEYANSEVSINNGPLNSIGTGQIDPSVPATFGDLRAMWGNAMKSHIYEVPTTPQWDVYGQENIHVRSTMSNLASSVISGLATEHKLASITFRYSTWSPNQVVSRMGAWSIESATPIINVSEEQYDSEVQRFMQDLEIGLFPTLKGIGGDFDIFVIFDMTGSTLVNLTYHDYGKQFGDSFYEHQNRLGGLAAPNVGNENSFNSNLQAYSNLMGHIGNQLEGPSSFGKGSNVIQHEATRQTILEQQYQ